jgi:hypothetical protein
VATQRKPHPADDFAEFTIVEWRDYKIEVKKKFPMFGFMRKLNGDPIGAIAMILSEGSLEELESIEMDFADLNELIEKISEGLGAKNAGN